jgi:hypothetical protein
VPGTVSAFGGATDAGPTSAAAIRGATSIVTHPAGGYWVAASDGGIFAFGDAPYLGSMGGHRQQAPITAVGADPGGNGYWLGLQSGQIVAYGPVDHGSPAELSGPRTVPLTGIAATTNGYRVLYGDEVTIGITARGPQVLAIQRRLLELGYWVGPLDGIYGELTHQAVMAFEKVEGLPVDGDADPHMVEVLEGASRPRPTSSSGDLVEIDITRQVLFVVRGGQVQWTFNISSGTEGPYVYEGTTRTAHTPRGRYTMSRQIDGWRESHLGRLYRPKYVVGGIAIHGSSHVPSYPASHGCVRISLAAMDLIWNEGLVEIGTRVWIRGPDWQPS